MTFDDGYYNVALTLQALFEQYDLYGSLMMISTRSIVDESAYQNGKLYASEKVWNELFDKGRLEPQDHSSEHLRLVGDANSIDVTPAILKSEMDDSKARLEGYFPEYDFLSYAIPYGNMTSDAYAHATDVYYAIRTTMYGVQTLDPDYSTNYGSWYAMRSPSMYRNGTDFDTQWATIKGDIDAVVEQKGWYLPIVHKVGDYDADPTWNSELPLETAHVMFKYISDLRDEGKVWVTTYSNAIK
jgi:peptidoglycan/xylan/chitin deacetylase (PgdA/CDA1 family)